MALVLTVLVLLVLPLLALATFTPWPVETSILFVALFTAALTAFVVRDPFLSMCAFVLFAAGAFTIGTVAESARLLAPPRRRRRRRRRPASAYAAETARPPLTAGLRDAA